MIISRARKIAILGIVLSIVTLAGGWVFLLKDKDNGISEYLSYENKKTESILDFDGWEIFLKSDEGLIKTGIAEIDNFNNSKNVFRTEFLPSVFNDGKKAIKISNDLKEEMDNLIVSRIRVKTAVSVSGNVSNGNKYLATQLNLEKTRKEISDTTDFLKSDGRIIFVLLNENYLNPTGGRVQEIRAYDISNGKLDIGNEVALSPEAVELLKKDDYSDLETKASDMYKVMDGKQTVMITINISALERIVGMIGIIEFPEENLVLDRQNVRKTALKKEDLLESIIMTLKERSVDFSLEKSLLVMDLIGSLADKNDIQVYSVTQKPEQIMEESVDYISLRPIFRFVENNSLRAKVEIETDISANGRQKTKVIFKRANPDELKGKMDIFAILSSLSGVLGNRYENKQTGGLNGINKRLIIKEYDNIGKEFSFEYERDFDVISGKVYRFLYEGPTGVDMPVSVKITVPGGYVFKETGRSEYVYENLESVKKLPIVLTLVRL